MIRCAPVFVSILLLLPHPVHAVEALFSGRNVIFLEDLPPDTNNQSYGKVSIQGLDIDSDGDFDLVTESSVFENLGGSPVRFLEHEIGGPGKKIGTVCDLNEDLSLDLVTDSGWFDVSGPLGGEAVFHPFPETGVTVFDSGDIDGDSDNDILCVQKSGEQNRLGWFRNDGGEDTSLVFVSIVSDSTHSVFDSVLEDLENDGDTDIAFASADGGIKWLQNDGTENTEFNEFVIPDSGLFPERVAITDLDSDGDMDLISYGRFDLAWFESDGGTTPTFKQRTISNHRLLGEVSMDIGDVNLDGIVDLVTNSSRRVNWYEQLPSPIPDFLNHRLSDPPVHEDGSRVCGPFNQTCNDVPTNRALCLADLDGDGDLDLCETHHAFAPRSPNRNQNYRFRQIVWYENLAGVYLSEARFVQAEDNGHTSETHEPGETGTLLIGLESRTGETLQDVAVRVLSENPGLVIESSEIIVDTIVSGATSTVLFDYEILEEAECGSLLTSSIEIDWGVSTSSGEAGPDLIGQSLVFKSVGSKSPGVSIPDNDPEGVESQAFINAPDTEIISAEVSVDINHTYRGDLEIFLTTPDSIEVPVFTADPNDGFLNLSETFAVEGVAGLSASGTYTLRVIDRASNDTGTLDSWTLEVVHREYVCSNQSESMTADFTGDGVIDEADLFEFSTRWEELPAVRKFDLNLDGEIGSADLHLYEARRGRPVN